MALELHTRLPGEFPPVEHLREEHEVDGGDKGRSHVLLYAGKLGLSAPHGSREVLMPDAVLRDEPALPGGQQGGPLLHEGLQPCHACCIILQSLSVPQ